LCLSWPQLQLCNPKLFTCTFCCNPRTLPPSFPLLPPPSVCVRVWGGGCGRGVLGVCSCVSGRGHAPSLAPRSPPKHTQARQQGIWFKAIYSSKHEGSGQSKEPVQPRAVMEAALPSLRACGLSERKASYLQDLARHFCEGHLSDELIAGACPCLFQLTAVLCTGRGATSTCLCAVPCGDVT
jgi:hypothetical protein